MEEQQPRNSSTIPESNRDTRTLNLILSTDSTITPKTKKTRRFQRKSSIVNLSNYKLTTAETTLLEKGLNFIPTPYQEHEAKITQDFLLFERKLRLYHKLNKEQTEETSSTEDSEEETPHKLLKPSKGYKPEDHEMDPNIL